MLPFAVEVKDGPYIINGKPYFVFKRVAYRVEKCRHCFKNIAMVPTKNNKLQPLNVDGSVHFATCVVLLARRERKAEKKPKQLKLF
jgi:hypothetical protein